MMGLTSCATIFTGSRDTISFKSTPSGATVYKDGIELCKTPCSVPIKRKLGETTVEYKLDGYESRLITLDKSFNLVSIINLGSLVGWGIDALSGSIMKYDQKAYDLKLSKDKSTTINLRTINPTEIKINTKTNTVDFIVTK
jgi:hypothetical protein